MYYKRRQGLKYKNMGSQQIHYEALRKQLIIDRRNEMNIRKTVSFIETYYKIFKINRKLNFLKSITCHHISHIMSLMSYLKMTCISKKSLFTKQPLLFMNSRNWTLMNHGNLWVDQMFTGKFNYSKTHYWKRER